MSLQVWLPLNGSLENKGLYSGLTVSGTPTYVNGIMGKAISLTPQVTFNNFPKLDKFTILFWAKIDSCTSDWADVIGFTSKQTDGSSAAEFRFEATKTSRACSFHNNSPYAITAGSRILITEAQKGEWHHVGVVYNGESIISYIDGVKTYTDTGLGGYLINGFHIGETTTMVGGMNDLRIYDNCLSTEQIKEISKGLVLHYPLNNGCGNDNLMRMGGLDKNGATSMTYDSSTDTYTIVSPAGTNSWGYGVSIRSTSEISIPYGKSYRASVEVYVPTQHSFVVDINNNVANGTTAWAGNDNDNTSKRTSTSFTIPANTWKKISWGSENSDGNNTDKVAILPYDKFGLKTNSDTDSVTWYLRHPKIELGTSVTDWCPNNLDIGNISNIEFDESGKEYNGTKVGVISQMDSPIGVGSYNFSSNGYVHRIPTILTTDNKNFSISFWTKFDNTSSTMCIYNNRTSTGSGIAVFYIGGKIRFDDGNDTEGHNHQWTTSKSFVKDTWYYICLTRSSTKKKMYIDGILVDETSDVGGLLHIGTQYASIGSSSTNGDAGSSNMFRGNITDFRIYCSELTAEDVRQMYFSKARIDKNGNVYCNQFVESNNMGNLLDDYQYPVNSTTRSGVFSKVLVDCQDSITGKATKMTCNTAGLGFYIGGCWNTARSKFVNGKQYIWSMYVKSDNRTSITFNVECSSKQSKNTFVIDTNYRRIESVFTYSNSTAYSAFTCYSNFKVNENLYIHTFSVDEYNPKTNVDKKGILHTNSLIEIKSEEKCKIYKQDIQSNEIIEI